MTLLRSKIGAPSLPAHAIARPRLLDRIRERPWSVILLQAPAGFGKSVLALQVRDAEPRSTAWLYLEPEDSDPRRFCRYLAGALAEVIPALAETELIQSPRGSEFQIHDWLDDLILFLEEFPRTPHRLILDNFESISDETAVSGLIERLLRHRPEKLSLLITTRSAPPIRIQKLIEKGEALVLDSTQLAFTLEEFKQAAGSRRLNRTAREIEELWSRSEGWCIYPGLGAEGSAPPGGAERDYLEEEIIAHLPEGVRAFLRRVSPLDVVTEDVLRFLDMETDSLAERVRELNRHGVPHLILDGGKVVRLHPMIRKRFLTEVLEVSTSEDPLLLAERIEGYYRSRERPATAVRVLIDLGAYERMLTFLKTEWAKLDEQNLLPRVKSWLELLPAEYRIHPLYVTAHVRYLRFMGENRTLIDYLEELKLSGHLPEDPSTLLPIWGAEAWARTHLAEGPGYRQLAAEWQQLEPAADPDSRLLGEYALSTAAMYDLRLGAALGHVETIQKLVAEDSAVLRANALNARSAVLQEMGRIEEALAAIEEGLALCRSQGDTVYQAICLIGKANILRDMGRFRESLDAVDGCLEIASRSGSTRLVLLPHASRTRGECLWALGHQEEALGHLEEAYDVFRNHNRYEGLATGVLIDHFRFLRGEQSGLVGEDDFTGPRKQCEARVRYLIHRCRREATAGALQIAVNTAREALDLAREMPFWQITIWSTEAWAWAQLDRDQESRHALEQAMELLVSLDRTSFHMADPELTAWNVAEAVANGFHPKRALRLLDHGKPIDLQPAFQRALEYREEAPQEVDRLVEVIIERPIRGLGKTLDKLGCVTEERKKTYRERIAGAPLPPLEIRMLGSFEVVGGSGDVHFSRRASRRILQVLLLEHPEPVHEEKLIDLLWPETDPAKAKRILQTSINDLRRALDPHLQPRGESYVLHENEHYRLVLPRGSSLDLLEFRKGLGVQPPAGRPENLGEDRIAALRDTLRLYRGDLLSEDTYEEYATEPRERLRALWQDGSAALARELMKESPEEAEQLLRRGLALDPYWTEGIALLIQGLSRQRRVLAAIRLYRDFERRLQEDLGLEPDPPLRAIFEALTENR